MLLRKKKSKGEGIADKAGELWENASATVSHAADSLTSGTATDNGGAKAAPSAPQTVADTHERADEGRELSRRKAKKARKRAAQAAALAAAAAKARAEVDSDAGADAEGAKPKKKKHRVRRFFFVAAIGTAIGFAIKKLTSPPSGGTYTPPPPPPEPIRPTTPPAPSVGSPAAAQPPEGQDGDVLTSRDDDPRTGLS